MSPAIFSVCCYAHVRQTNAGHLFAAPTDVILSDVDVVQPDILFISSSRSAIIAAHYIQGPPDLVVEILSETTRRLDEVVKRKLYERHGVTEYWIVDPELEAVKCYRMTEPGYLRPVELVWEAGDTLRTPLLPGLHLPLAEIFA